MSLPLWGGAEHKTTFFLDHHDADSVYTLGVLFPFFLVCL